MKNPQNVEFQERLYAGIFDEEISESEAFGTCHDPDAVGGCSGVEWLSYYRDANTGEVYYVRCSDSECGGRGPYRRQDNQYRQQCFYELVDRHHQAVRSGATEIRMASVEWRLMKTFHHSSWLVNSLDLSPSKRSYTKGDLNKSEGIIGYIAGVPVIVDPEVEPKFPERSE